MPQSDEQELAYRRALGCFATGIAVVTVSTAAGPMGLTVNSFTSASLRPRLVLWCLDERSERGAAFLQAGQFAINVLGVEQRNLASQCAEPGGGALPVVECEEIDPAPLLRQALARFLCRTVEHRPIGDHVLIVGEVERFESRPGSGLTYFRGRYGEAPAGGAAAQ